MEKSNKIISRKILEHTLLMPLEKIELGDFYKLNETGSFLWENLENYQTVDEMALALSKSFNVSYAEAKNGTVRFVQDLIELKVIQ